MVNGSIYDIVVSEEKKMKDGMGDKMTYTTNGDVRGSCGHAHKTIEAAARCLEYDREGCAGQGGYSDRHIIASDEQHVSWCPRCWLPTEPETSSIIRANGVCTCQ